MNGEIGKVHVAGKAWMCDFCGGAIAKGERYLSINGKKKCERCAGEQSIRLAIADWLLEKEMRRERRGGGWKYL